MNIVVVLALVVLVAVFLFSLFMIIVTCQRKRQYNRLIESQSLRFSKLHQANLDDIGQLGPHISRTLDRNHWIDELATGLIQHCVAILKICHSMTERMAQIPLDKQQCQPELNELICRATSRVMPLFEAVLRSMADNNVDIRVIEARASALVSACWALVVPFAMANPKHKVEMEELVGQMDKHLQALQLAHDQFEEDQRQLADNNEAGTSTQQEEEKQQQIHHHPSTSKQNSSQQRMQASAAATTIGVEMPSGSIKLRVEENDEATLSLLADETAPPADPAIT